MAQDIEYSDSIRIICELLWGEGFMAPGGEGNVDNLVRGLELRDKRVLDVGSGLGGPAFYLAETYGASVVGIDIEPRQIEISERRAQELGLEAQTEFVLVEPGPLKFPDAFFDFVISSGGFTHIEDKLSAMIEALRVLKPNGVLSCYDWMKCEGEYSEEMLYFFELEGITYEMETPDRHGELLEMAGFADVSIDDRSQWYRQYVQVEHRNLQSDLNPKVVELMGQAGADHFVESWRTLAALCEKGELLQGYSTTSIRFGPGSASAFVSALVSSPLDSTRTEGTPKLRPSPAQSITGFVRSVRARALAPGSAIPARPSSICRMRYLRFAQITLVTSRPSRAMVHSACNV